MSEADSFQIDVAVRFVAGESDPDAGRFVFAYTITISNLGEESAQLVSRYWRITNGEGEVQEVAGPGVVGKQPHIAPNASYRYTSAAVLETPVGTMEGHYEFRREGRAFKVPIPVFSLSQPNTVH